MTARDYRYLSPDGEGVGSLPDGVGAALGSDYCVHLLPSPGRMAEVVEAAAGRGTPVVLMTPYFRDAELKRAIPLFRAIPKGADVDVAVNDWGALRMLRGLFPWMTLSLGRLLSGQKRCPRIGGSGRLTEEGRRWQGEGIFSSAPAREHLSSEYGVTRYHVDNLPWGTGVDGIKPEGGPFLYVHAPWAVVTVSDGCPWLGGKSSADVTECRRECRGGGVTLREPSMGGDMAQRGKARFASYGTEAFPPLLPATKICRVLYAELP